MECSRMGPVNELPYPARESRHEEEEEACEASSSFHSTSPPSPQPSEKREEKKRASVRRSAVSSERERRALCSLFSMAIVLLSSFSSAVITRTPPPIKLLQGCSGSLLHARFFGHVRVMCRAQPATAVAAYEGVNDAMAECAERMKFLPWDCSHTEDIMHDPLLLRYGYKESAVVHALSAAGAAWGVATACSQGWLPECECGRVHHSQSTSALWEWGGCAHGIQYGITVSRKMLTRTTGAAGTPNALRRLEKHNLKAGRLAVKKTLTSICKCHGVSGSCQQKTCWKAPASMSNIVRHIVEKYHKARRLGDEGSKQRNNDLFFLEPSPDHCAIHGNTPRVCGWRNETHAQGDCGRLCCGRGFNITHEVKSYKCDCKFVWCCQLSCNDCLQHRWVSTCT